MVVHALHLARAEDSTRSLLRRPTPNDSARQSVSMTRGVSMSAAFTSVCTAQFPHAMS